MVKAVEEYRERETPPAFYMQPSLDGSRQGQYYINTYQPEERPLHKIAAITFHEATPGHHFQIAIEMELTGLPRFRTLGGRMAGVAYVEGWGLYCERLSDEMGLYLDDRERLGMLDAQAFRASRLVVDSGLHAMGWTRDKAIQFMHERGTLPMVDAEIEVDRYTVWPGQALSYKIGQREIERARREVSREDGRPIRPARLPRRGAGPRHAAPGHAPPRDPELGRGGRRGAGGRGLSLGRVPAGVKGPDSHQEHTSASESASRRPYSHGA